MKPFAKRLLNVFAGILNTVVVIDLALSITNVVVVVKEGLTNDSVIIGLAVFILPIAFVSIANYLTFGKFRVWNRLMAHSPQENHD